MPWLWQRNCSWTAGRRSKKSVTAVCIRLSFLGCDASIQRYKDMYLTSSSEPQQANVFIPMHACQCTYATMHQTPLVPSLRTLCREEETLKITPRCLQRRRHTQSTPRYAKCRPFPTLSERQLHFPFPPEIFIVLICPGVMLDAQTRDIRTHAAGHRRG